MPQGWCSLPGRVMSPALFYEHAALFGFEAGRCTPITLPSGCWSIAFVLNLTDGSMFKCRC